MHQPGHKQARLPMWNQVRKQCKEEDTKREDQRHGIFENKLKKGKVQEKQDCQDNIFEHNQAK